MSFPWRRLISPKWHRKAVGGAWDTIGPAQLDFMKSRGMEPDDHLLDVGCGSLRGGVHLIRFLSPERYHGVDADQALLGAGRRELEKAGLASKNPVLTQMEDFGFHRLEREFDWALAHSLFTHLNMNAIYRCLSNVRRVLRPSGKFFATYFEVDLDSEGFAPVQQTTHNGSPIMTYFDRDPYHYPWELLRDLGQAAGFKVKRVGEWGHPRNQFMMAFLPE